jgi:redox-sensitive bicupin YhaK (pirin superfamily)
LSFAKLDAGQKISQPLAKDRHAWVHVAEGEVKLNGKTLLGGDAAAIDNETAIELVGVKPSQVLLFDLN